MTTSGKRRRIILGSAALAAVATLASPGSGQAHAHGYSTPSGDAVGRPGLDNPAPGVRLTQAIGDKIFNPQNAKLDGSKLGQNYHNAFGTPDYDVPTHGSNGTNKGALNTPGALQAKYNGAQAAGRGLPDEEDLRGTLIRKVSGAPAPTPHETENSPQQSVAVPSNCTVLTAHTSLRVQGSC
jgi:hypothetical protein